MKRYIIIVAGGRGLRMGNDLPKQFIPLNGKPILMHTLETFHQWDPTATPILVLPADHQPYWNMLCQEIGCTIPHSIVNGGETRYHSVRNGLQYLTETLKNEKEATTDIQVAIHDGVRPFVSPEVIEHCFTQARTTGAAIPVIPIIDSLRKQTGPTSHPVDRTQYYAVQTPQVFAYELLTQAYEQPYSATFTDDATVVEALGHPVTTVPGNRENIKITTPFDLKIAQTLN